MNARHEKDFRMNEQSPLLTSRRDFIKSTSTAAVGAGLVGALAGCKTTPTAKPGYVAEKNTIQVALIGCGGRGGGAAKNALMVKYGPTKLVAMADVFEDRLNTALKNLTREFPKQVDVPKERQFIGFDGYKHAIDCLKPGDVAIFTTPLAFRWVHFTYAIQKGVNVFMEKPLTADGPTSRRMLKLGEEASAKNLKVGVGLMSRHHRPLQELHKRVQDGQIGDILFMRGYRMHGPVASFASEKWPGEPSELLWQIKRFHSFLWASGGCYNDFYIHHIDHLSWMKNSWPVSAQGLGGRHYRENFVDQNFDSYAVEYTYADGAKLYMDGRCMTGCHDIYSSYVHGTKGMAIAAKSGDFNGPSSIYKGKIPMRKQMTWESKDIPGEEDPYLNEWNDLIYAIRNDKPYNETKHGVDGSVASSMGRMAAHTGQLITFDDFLASKQEFAPGVDKWTMDSPPPIKADANGRYPVPQPGRLKDREY